MEVAGFLAFLSILCFLVSLLLLIVFIIMKKEKKKPLIGLAVSLSLFVIIASLSIATSNQENIEALSAVESQEYDIDKEPQQQWQPWTNGYDKLVKYEWGEVAQTTLREIGVEKIKKVDVRYYEDSSTITDVTITTDTCKLSTYPTKAQGGWYLLWVSNKSEGLPFGAYFYLTESLKFDDAGKLSKDIYDYRTRELTQKAEADLSASETQNNTITIVYGEAGKYGEAVPDVPYRYYIPSGKYIVSTITENSGFLIIKNEKAKNSDGKYEDIILERVALTLTKEVGPSVATVNVPENCHIVLILNSKLEFNML